MWYKVVHSYCVRLKGLTMYVYRNDNNCFK